VTSLSFQWILVPDGVSPQLNLHPSGDAALVVSTARVFVCGRLKPLPSRSSVSMTSGAGGKVNLSGDLGDAADALRAGRFGGEKRS
jgi:hypothetical protein